MIVLLTSLGGDIYSYSVDSYGEAMAIVREAQLETGPMYYDILEDEEDEI